MPDLAQSLRNYDLERLNNIAQLWGVELSAPDSKQAAAHLAEAVLNPDLIQDVIGSLSEDAIAALSVLPLDEGRMPWARFTRQFGEVREMGTGKRSRQQPHRDPASITETLWYLGLVARAFFDTSSGPQEFAYIPTDLLSKLSLPTPTPPDVFGRPAQKGERAKSTPAGSRILDHACTLLAVKRVDMSDLEIKEISAGWTSTPEFITQVLTAAGVLAENGVPLSENLRAFLEADRAAALNQLLGAWLESDQINDLLSVPHLQAEGGWDNHPLRARQVFIEMLEKVPAGKWWSLTAFINDIAQHHPDFQRPAGDYDSWYLKDARTGEFLRGFEHWHSVDAELIRYLITGPLHWLGVMDLASAGEGQEPSAFRFTDLRSSHISKDLNKESAQLKIDSKGFLTIPPLFPRAARYQLARFCDYGSESKGQYTYRLTPASLARARSQDLTIKQLLALLRKHAADPAPPSLLKALKRWQQHGAQVRIENVVVLRVDSPDILKELQSSRAARFLGDPIGPTTVQVKSGAHQQILDALTGLGYLGQVDIEHGD